MTTSPDFTSLTLPQALLTGIDACGFVHMTEVQVASLPSILEGRDVIAQAKTGSGKTAAFALGLLHAIDPSRIALQGLVLCPTRELADQVSRDIRRLAVALPNLKVLTLCGGIPLRPQLASLRHEPHLIVGTPGRLLDLQRRGELPSLGNVRVLVLDEADRMLDMGFTDEVLELVAQTPQDRQTLLFSATYSEPVRDISRRVQRDAVTVDVAATLSADEVEQRFYGVESEHKFELARRLLVQLRPASCLLFCNTKQSVRELAAAFAERGDSVLALHGDLEQRDREEVLVQFANHSAMLLVATDVAARGLDIKDLPLVLNYEIAQDPDIHLHRIGRTGRAGAKGLAVSLCTARERTHAKAIEAAARADADEGAVEPIRWLNPTVDRAAPKPLVAVMTTLVIDAGRQDKLRPGDVLGALTTAEGLSATDVGKIDVYPTRTYVAIRRRAMQQALALLQGGRIKNRKFRVRQLR